MKKMTTKTTLSGVKSESTRAMFKDLKKRGFASSLEKGSKSTFKIICFVNGVDFAISCVDGKAPIYSKNYSRGARKWVKFDNVDQLLLVSMTKANSPPTDKQVAYFDDLISDVKQITSKIVKINYPKDCPSMITAIDEARWLLTEINNGCVSDYTGTYVNI
jgi:hypothetical protein